MTDTTPVPPAPTWSRYAPAAAVALAAVGLVLRAGGVFRMWINGDEGIYYVIAHMEWAEATIAIESNAHPPLFYVLLRLMAAFANDHTVLRLPALFCGALVIYLGFAWTRRLAGPAPGPAAAAGLLAALLLTISPGAIMLSQVARPYMVQSALLFGALLFWWRHAASGRRRDLVGYSLTLSLALLVHYSSMLVWAALGLVQLGALLCGRRPTGKLSPLLWAQLPALAVLGYSAVTHIGRRLMGGPLQDEAVGGWLRPFFLDSVAQAWPAFLGLGEYLAGAGQVVAPAALILVGLVSCLRHPGSRGFAALAAVTLGLAVVLSRLQLYPFGGHRHSFYLATLLVPLAAIALVRTCGAGRRAGVVAGVLWVALAAGDRWLAPWLGAGPGRPLPFQELRVGMAEIDEFAARLDQWRSQDGLLILDMQTAYSLAPLLNDQLQALEWHDGIGYQPFGRRTMVFTSAWALQAGPRALQAPDHLAVLLQRLPKVLPAELLQRGADRVRLVSCQGARLPNQIHALGQSLPAPRQLFEHSSIYAGRTYVAARLDAAAYLAAHATLTGR